MQKALLCGAAREIITPKVGTALYGYRPNLFSESLHDDLTVTAVAFPDSLLITATLGDINTALCDSWRQQLSQDTGIPMENIILCATHTHCAPNVSGVEGWGEIDHEYVDGIFLPALRKACTNAVSSMAPAEIAYATGKSDVGINRREQLQDGTVILGQNPWGQYDPVMTILKLRNAETQKGIVTIVHYGCHGTACGANPEITRDWSGIMIDRMEQESGVLTCFMNGAIGDVGPRLTNGKTVGNIRYVEELGAVAAQDAMRIAEKAKDYHAETVSLHVDRARLPYQKHPKLSEVQEALSEIKNPDALINIERLRYKHLVDVQELLLAGKTEVPEDFSFPLPILQIGSTAFIPFPFEIFSEISQRLRQYSGLANTLCLSCANGYEGYLPTQDQLCRGGYEVGVFRYAMKYALADDTDQNLIQEALRILQK